MPILWILVTVLVLGAVGYSMGRRRALASAGGDPRLLHSLPNFSGLNVFLFAVVPALLVLVVWMLVQPALIQSRLTQMLPGSADADAGEISLMMADMRRIADGLDLAVTEGVLTDTEARALMLA